MHLFVALSLCVSLVLALPVSVDKADNTPNNIVVSDANNMEFKRAHCQLNSKPEEAGFFEGDIELEPGEEPYHRNAVTDPKRLWPNGVVPYTIDAAHQKNARHVENFHDAMNEMMNVTKVNGKKCIDFQPHNSSRGAYIQFTNGTGCHTPLGYRSNRRSSVTLGKGCMGRGTIMHEILHALGFGHEQGRADRDSYVTIHWDNIRPGHAGNFKNRHRDFLNLPYDYKSVMHYPAYAFAIDKDVMTIEPKQRGITIGHRKGLSGIDVKKIQILYGCIPKPNKGAVTTPNPFGEHGTPQISNITALHGNTSNSATCTFDSGLCGWLQSTQDDIDWTTGQGITPSRHTGPHTDHTGNIGGHYLYLEASKNTNKTAILVSPTYAGGTYCFSAWYNMYGHEMGYLYFKTIKRGHIHTLRSIHGNHRDKWIYFQAQIKMQNSTPFQFQIKGSVGPSYHSDMAIDDVSVTPGYCAHG